MDEKIIYKLIKLSNKAAKTKNIPVAALIVHKNKIISYGYNKRYKKYDVTNHAEIIAIKKAAKKLKDWRLNECDLYVTLKPCAMCNEIIKQSRIKNVYYLVDQTKNVNLKCNINKYKTDNENLNNIINKYQENLSDFFKINCKR